MRDSASAWTIVVCLATEDGKPRLIGETIAEAMAHYCSPCPVPPALATAPRNAVPEFTFYLGGERDLLWRCSACGHLADDLGELESCHPEVQ